MLEFSGQDEGFLDESAIVDSPEPLEVLNQVPSKTSATGKGTVKRKYHDSYLDIGFVEISDNKSHCVICGKVLPNISMFPAKMRRHFEGSIQTARTNRVISSEGSTVNLRKPRKLYPITQKQLMKRL